MTVRRAAAALAAALGLAGGCATPALAQVRAVFPSHDGRGAEPVMLSAQWLRSAAVVGQARPAAVVLHGCEGLWQDEGGERLRPDLLALAEALRSGGWHVLLVDSLRPRGVAEACSAKIAARNVRTMHRMRDALGALDWLAQQDGVDAGQLVLVGLGQGGGAALAAVDRRHPPVRQAGVAARAAVALDPVCGGGGGAAADLAVPVRIVLAKATRSDVAEACPAARASQVEWVRLADPAPHGRGDKAGAGTGEGSASGAAPDAGAAARLRRQAEAVAAVLREWRGGP